MFPTRAFADRYFAPRYFPKVGADAVLGTPYDRITCIAEDDRAYEVPVESRTATILGDPTCEE